jgi:glycosyltransferase involved in cell wall biosynthesis
MKREKYVLMTAARNEGAFIETTIEAVLNQTVLPEQWIIASDGSTDDTVTIVERYASKHSFIRLKQLAANNYRQFAAKAHALRMVYESLQGENYCFIGNLDADVSFDNDYYERILAEFDDNPRLGIAGGVVLELQKGEFKKLKYNLESVAGAVQTFRRECFEAVGGYLPLKQGGLDAVAEVMARMNGWQVKTFSQYHVYHHRQIGDVGGKVLRARFRFGLRDYLIGVHPVFMLLKCAHRLLQKPYFIGSAVWFSGYLCAWLRREVSPVPHEVIRFQRKEQRRRIISAISNLPKRGNPCEVSPA